MNKILFHKTLESKAFFALFSFLLSFTIWSNVIHWIPSNIWLNTPICFYNHATDQIIEAPEEIKICLRGPQYIIKNLKKNEIAAHINLKNLNNGENKVILNESHFFLPTSVKIRDINPLIITLISSYGHCELTNKSTH